MSSRFPIGVPTTNSRPIKWEVKTSGLDELIFTGIAFTTSMIIFRGDSRVYQFNSDEAIRVIAQPSEISILNTVIGAGIISTNFYVGRPACPFMNIGA